MQATQDVLERQTWGATDWGVGREPRSLSNGKMEHECRSKTARLYQP